MTENQINPLTQNKIRTVVKKYLQANNLSETDLAEMMGLRPQTVKNYLYNTAISVKTVRNISRALEYPYDLLIQGEYWESETKIQELERRIKALEDYIFSNKK